MVEGKAEGGRNGGGGKEEEGERDKEGEGAEKARNEKSDTATHLF